MHDAPGHRKQRTMTQQMKLLLVVLLLILAVYITGSLLVLGQIRRRALRDMDEMSTLYTNELDNRFLRISRKLFSTIMEKRQPGSVFWNYVNMILDEEETMEYPLSRLRELYLSGIWEYGQEYQLFLYLNERNEYWHLSLTPEGGYTVPEAVKEAMKEQARAVQDDSYSVKKKWNIVTCGGETYMCKIAQGEGVSIGCYVNVKSILEPFSRITVGEQGYVCLVDEEGNCVILLTHEGISDVGSGNEAVGVYSIRKTLRQAPFEIQMRVSGERLIQIMMGSVAVLAVIAGILIGAAAFILLSLKRNLIAPIQTFIDDLEGYDEGSSPISITESGLLELERIDDKFKHMIRQIQKLKISLYEQELEKQKIENAYLKLQIKPHFYLNCLNFIYSMIDFGKYAYAQRMSKITAEYLTYIFRNANEWVPVTAEVEHCRNYLKILLLRYPESFEYYIEVQEEIQDALIFPFLIQVFVENAAKHALTLTEKILISVTVYPEDRDDGKYVNIYISDTGKGFPEHILQKLQAGESLADRGQHMGIENCKKRFRYYYREKGELYFENSPLGGAIVDIHLPYEKGGNNESITG